MVSDCESCCEDNNVGSNREIRGEESVQGSVSQQEREREREREREKLNAETIKLRRKHRNKSARA